MDNINKTYLNITLESKINWIKQNNLDFDYSPIILPPDRYNSSYLFFIINDLNGEHIILEDIYKKSIFKDFINKVKICKNIDIILLSEMKQFLGNKLKPIKNNIDIIIFKFDFLNVLNFSNGIIQLFGKTEYENNKDFYLNKIYNQLVQTKGACWRISETKIIMFLDINNLIDLTIMHECIHYIQVVTEKSILHQQTKLEKSNNMIFTNSEAITYMNSFCHIIDGFFTYKEILNGFNSLLREKQLTVSKNENISKYEFFQKCFDLIFIKKYFQITSEQTPLIWILTCIYENKHIDLIRSHLIFYFQNN